MDSGAPHSLQLLEEPGNFLPQLQLSGSWGFFQQTPTEALPCAQHRGADSRSRLFPSVVRASRSFPESPHGPGGLVSGTVSFAKSVLPSFLKMAFLRPRPQGPSASGRGCCETVPASPPLCERQALSGGCDPKMARLRAVSWGDPLAGVAHLWQWDRARGDQLWQPARLPARPPLNAGLPVHCPVFGGGHLIFILSLKPSFLGEPGFSLKESSIGFQ